ncbi:MAG: hypothetical protein M3P11_13025 [Actinomycetota bacterium]|nr:hypothetical protein [Actinomycetota bacterium]
MGGRGQTMLRLIATVVVAVAVMFTAPVNASASGLVDTAPPSFDQLPATCISAIDALLAAMGSQDVGWVCDPETGLAPQSREQRTVMQGADIDIARAKEGTPAAPEVIVDRHHWYADPPRLYYGIGTNVIGSGEELYAVELSFSTSDVDIEEFTWESGPQLKRRVYHRIWNDSANAGTFSDSATELTYNRGTFGEYNWDIVVYQLHGATHHYYFRISFWSLAHPNPSTGDGRFFAPPHDSAQYVCGNQFGCEF